MCRADDGVFVSAGRCSIWRMWRGDAERWPLEFSHSLEEQLGGQTEAGFLLAGLYEDRDDPATDPVARIMPNLIATRAIKPR